mmetsp:Transcript_50103/g.119228  ORF Transcript_50103/g.119228 Transcript_50103/m.119228 type:complete len:1075 (-) Transcript_50103:35-3259(-)
MSQIIVLMVAEKPSIAMTLAGALSAGAKVRKRRGVSPVSPVYEYEGIFKGYKATYRITATTGHVFSLDFADAANKWEQVQPGDLFHADTVRKCDAHAQIPEHIMSESRGVDALVLWLDCDREGENICFEVISLALPQMQPRVRWEEAYHGFVFRAMFSSLVDQDLQSAMINLGVPDKRQSDSVEARQEIDLRLGVAFSRLQTMYFRKHFGSQLGNKMVTYGPCQFPTLWFCVKRHCEREAFEPQPYWTLRMVVSIDRTNLQCEGSEGAIWDEADAHQRLRRLQESGNRAKIGKVHSRRTKLAKPLPLNTVALLRMASEELGLSPGDALHHAEYLYLKGFTSYPRTETDKYPPNFDLKGTAEMLAGRGESAPWVFQAQRMLSEKISEPRDDGYDAGDHPPITPVAFATGPEQCGGQAAWILYQAICIHFLATIAPDAFFEEADMEIHFEGETFVTSSRRCVRSGWLKVTEQEMPDQGPMDLRNLSGREGFSTTVVSVDLDHDLTKPPRHITESELLGLMEKHQIGTDASMATHVSNVQKRLYVEVDQSTREMVPSALGLALANAYALIDLGLILPSVRAKIERDCNSVAKGRATKEQVVTRSIRNFERRFCHFATRIDRLPLMLAIAYAQQRSGKAPMGDAAEYGLSMWREAQAVHLSIALESLLPDAPEFTEVETDDEQVMDVPPSRDATRLVLERTEVVQRVQQVLEDLGFAACKEKVKEAKAIAQAEALAAEFGPYLNEASAAPAAAKQPSAERVALEERITSVLRQHGGSLELGRLTGAITGLKKKQVESFAAFKLVPGQNGQCQVILRTVMPGEAAASSSACGSAAGATATAAPAGPAGPAAAGGGGRGRGGGGGGGGGAGRGGGGGAGAGGRGGRGGGGGGFGLGLNFNAMGGRGPGGGGAGAGRGGGAGGGGRRGGGGRGQGRNPGPPPMSDVGGNAPGDLGPGYLHPGPPRHPGLAANSAGPSMGAAALAHQAPLIPQQFQPLGQMVPPQQQQQPQQVMMLQFPFPGGLGSSFPQGGFSGAPPPSSSDHMQQQCPYRPMSVPSPNVFYNPAMESLQSENGGWDSPRD